MGSLFAIFTLLTFNSCGKTKEKEVDVSNTEITGTIKDFVKLLMVITNLRITVKKLLLLYNLN